MKMKALLLIGILPFAASAATVQSALRNSEGVIKFNAKSYYPAYQTFLKALESDPLNPALHLNLARTLEANEEYDKSELAYRSALQLLPKDSPLRFQALFNLGGVLGKQKKIDEALAAYQAALDLVPESKEVKTNIELLWQGGGDGGGDDKNKDQKDQKGKDKKPDQGEGDKKDQKQQPQEPDKDQKQKPHPFQSQDLTPQDVQKILDEIKNQEQSIRAQEYERNAKEAPRGKDW
jgi:Ca-activated chloride channel family protein